MQECYLRALRHFDSYRGPAMKPWLFAILRNVCHAEFARRAAQPMAAEPNENERSAERHRCGRSRRKRRRRNCCAGMTARPSGG